jgi:hypothetical protein
MIEGWCIQAMEACAKKDNDQVVDENSRIACRLHAHLLLLYRNNHLKELDPNTVSTIMSSTIFLTTRHTWNMNLLQVRPRCVSSLG